MFVSPIKLTPSFIADSESVFNTLMFELDWERREDAPRYECWMNDFNMSYTYGRGVGERTYHAKPYHIMVSSIRKHIATTTGVEYEAALLNRYDNGFDHLGWHADDSPSN